MKGFFLIPLATLLLTVAQVLAASGEEALWIVSGQSNACGRAKLIEFAADSRVTMFNPDTGQFAVAQDPLPGMNTKGMGPWVVAGQGRAS